MPSEPRAMLYCQLNEYQVMLKLIPVTISIHHPIYVLVFFVQNCTQNVTRKHELEVSFKPAAIYFIKKPLAKE